MQPATAARTSSVSSRAHERAQLRDAAGGQYGDRQISSSSRTEGSSPDTRREESSAFHGALQRIAAVHECEVARLRESLERVAALARRAVPVATAAADSCPDFVDFVQEVAGALGAHSPVSAASQEWQARAASGSKAHLSPHFAETVEARPLRFRSTELEFLKGSDEDPEGSNSKKGNRECTDAVVDNLASVVPAEAMEPQKQSTPPQVTGREHPSEGAPTSRVGTDASRTMTFASTRRRSGDRRMHRKCYPNVTWRWRRTNGNYAAYPEAQSHRIEHAYRQGLARVRIKSGNTGNIPMEIFFTDMIQLDPMSLNTRPVRRDAPSETRWQRWELQLKRHGAAMHRRIISGDKAWETFEQYKRRQDLNAGRISESYDSVELLDEVSDHEIGQRTCKARCAKLANRRSFFAASMFLTFLQAVWIGIDADLNDGVFIYDRPIWCQVLEQVFCIGFTIELAIRLYAIRRCRYILRDPWLCFDIFCVSGALLEVEVLPLVALAQGTQQRSLALQALRLTRIAKLIRVGRMLGASSEAIPFINGLIAGMRSASFVWATLAMMLFVFGVILKTNVQDVEVRELYFRTVPLSMRTLLLQGTLLDEIAALVDALSADSSDWFSVFCFYAFMFISYFVLLNMLVGAFCSVSFEVQALEKDAMEVHYLEYSLEDILEAYMEGDEVGDQRLINKEKFDLIMDNADVHKVLSHCGTDMDGLQLIAGNIFEQKTDSLTFYQFFRLIVRLRKGKPATLRDVMEIQELFSRRCDRIESMLGVERSKAL